jgi:hypothetical protein
MSSLLFLQHFSLKEVNFSFIFFFFYFVIVFVICVCACLLLQTQRQKERGGGHCNPLAFLVCSSSIRHGVALPLDF